MTAKFAGYREDFEGYRDDATSAIKALASATSQSAREELASDAKDNISEAERLLRVLEVEARGGNAQARQSMQTQVGSCRQQLEQLKTSLERAKLVGGSDQRTAQRRAANPNATHKEKLVRTQEQIDRNDDLLYDAQIVVEETTGIANNITTNLTDQRSHLVNARDNVDETREDALEAGEHLKSLRRKHAIQIGILYFIVLGLLAGIVASVIKKATGGTA